LVSTRPAPSCTTTTGRDSTHPFDHQKRTAAFLTLYHRCLVLNEIGTGKTQSSLWAADYLIKTKKVKKVLILSPLSTLERVWGDGIFTGFS
jgi:SNF2 family DNA or RNA helicase